MNVVAVRGADKAKNNADTGAIVGAATLAATAAARLYSVSAYNGSAGTLYLQVHDSAAVPAEGAVPLLVQPVGAAQNGWFEFTNGRPFKNGIYACYSTTDLTKTLSASVQTIVDVSSRNEA